MGTMALPPGFRFHPTDEELVGYYLKRKVYGSEIDLEIIPVIDLYKFDPWELPDKSFLPKRDMEWFFFCPRDKKYPNGSRTNRATASGYWKATGKDRKIDSCQSVTALRKTLVFYRGRAPAGDRTDWVMHEYRLCEEIAQGITNFVGAFALCHVTKRNELGQRSGEPQGESKGTRGVSSSTDNNNPCSRRCMGDDTNAPEDSPPKPSNAFCTNYASFPTSPAENGRGTQVDPIVVDQDRTSPGKAESLISDSSQVFPLEGNDASPLMLQDEFQVSQLQSPFYTPMDFSLTAPCVNLNEEAEYMMPCLSPMDSTDLWINENSLAFQNLQWEDPRNLNQPMNGAESWSFMFSPLICRQASGDGIGEPANPWFLDDFVR